MEILAVALVGLVVFVASVATYLILEEKRKNNILLDRCIQIEGEEDRLFVFLHELGEAISNNASETEVRSKIANGASEVIGSKGAAIYLHDIKSKKLVPAFYTKECPPLVNVPDRILDQTRKKPAVMRSFLRLHAIGDDEGALGKCFQSSKAYKIKDLSKMKELNSKVNSYQIGVSCMLVPLIHNGRAFGVLGVAGKQKFSENDYVVFQSIGDQSAFAVANAITYREAKEKKRLEEELSNAREIQRVLLPREDPNLVDYKFSAFNSPARHLSGDYYDYVKVDDKHYGIAIGDVSGKGIASSLLTAMCRSVMRASASNQHIPSQVLSEVNRVIFPDMLEDMFISSIYMILDKNSNTVRFSRAGHSPVLHWHKDRKELSSYEPKGMAMGLDSGRVFDRILQDQEFTMEQGDCLLLYTDGVLDATDRNGFEYGAKRVKKVFSQNASSGVHELIEAFKTDLVEFQNSASQVDDITLIAIEKQ